MLKTILFTLLTVSAHAEYKIYPGCEQPATSYTREIYIDPVNGLDTNDGSKEKPWKTTIVAKVKGGDHVIYLPGEHKSFSFNKYKSKQLLENPTWVWMDFKEGATIPSIDVDHISRMLITNPRFRGTPGKAVNFSPRQGVLSGSDFLGLDKEIDAVTKEEWMSLPSWGGSRNGQCISFVGNKAKIMRSGMTISSDNKLYPDNSVKVLFEDNEFKGFSNDASRAIASDVIIRNNSFIGGFLTTAMGDANHDDMFQGFALDGDVFENLLIEGNTMIDKVNENPLAGNYQGISIFDGPYKKVTVRKNIVIVGAYHGISMYGSDDVTIENNTVVSSYLPGKRSAWIGIFKGKSGAVPTNNVVKNNLASSFQNKDLSKNENNFVISDPVANYTEFSIKDGKYNLNLKSTSPAFCKGAGAL